MCRDTGHMQFTLTLVARLEPLFKADIFQEISGSHIFTHALFKFQSSGKQPLCWLAGDERECGNVCNYVCIREKRNIILYNFRSMSNIF